MMKDRGTATIVIIIILSSASILIGSTILMHSPLKAQQQQQQQDQQPIVMRIQNTSMSEPAPNAPFNNQTLPHQIVVALPIRHDGKIWTGTVTFTASKPIEVEVEHKYNRYNATIDAKHGAKWFDGTNIALSTMTMFTNTPVAVTYTLDAVANPLTPPSSLSNLK